MSRYRDLFVLFLVLIYFIFHVISEMYAEIGTIFSNISNLNKYIYLSIVYYIF